MKRSVNFMILGIGGLRLQLVAGLHAIIHLHRRAGPQAEHSRAHDFVARFQAGRDRDADRRASRLVSQIAAAPLSLVCHRGRLALSLHRQSRRREHRRSPKRGSRAPSPAPAAMTSTSTNMPGRSLCSGFLSVACTMILRVLSSTCESIAVISPSNRLFPRRWRSPAAFLPTRDLAQVLLRQAQTPRKSDRAIAAGRSSRRDSDTGRGSPGECRPRHRTAR